MKKIVYSIAILSLFMTSCVDESDLYNNDQDKAYDVPAATLLANAQKELADQMVTGSVNLSAFRFFSQYWAATQYTTETRYRLTTRSVPDNHWNNIFRDVIGNLETAKGLVTKEIKPSSVPQADWDAQQTNKLAVIEIQQVYAFQILVDTFGDIPYSEAVTPGIVLPVYEDDSTIYPKLIERLNAALATLNTAAGSFASGDLIYSGDVESWRLFGNSLKVKLGINLSDVDSALAQSTIESAVTAGVITNNSQNAGFHYVAAPPNYNQIYADLVASGRNDYVPASAIVDAMNAVDDPRRAVYFTEFGDIYKGAVYGAANNYNNFSHVGDALKQPDFPGKLFEATEVNFYLAEAAARGYAVGGTAESYYNAAIEASFEDWGLSAVDAAGYLANPAVAYATAEGTYKQKIGTQAWIAFYNRGFESWTSWRRLDFPVLEFPSNALPEAEGEIPKRYTYPVLEQTVNTANWTAASTAIGGDKLKTHIFWDVN